MLAGWAAGLFATITEGVAAAVDLAVAIVPMSTSHVVYRQLRGRGEQFRSRVFRTCQPHRWCPSPFPEGALIL